MTTREQMLASIHANQPDLVPLPAVFCYSVAYPDTARQFSDVLTQIGGDVVRVVTYTDIADHLRQQYGIGAAGWATTIPELACLCDVDLATIRDLRELAGLNLVIIEGLLGVAENGAIWVDERHLTHRVLPMIPQYLAIILRSSCLVSTMHEAYRRISVDATGFGTFIAGPSKTADIEQSLVIGAHGARGLTVYLLAE